MRNLTHEECLFAAKEAEKPNKTFSTIAYQLDCDCRIVCHVIAHFNATRLLTEQERPGRLPSLTGG